MIKTNIGPNSIVEKVIIDRKSSVDVLYYDMFLSMGYTRKDLSLSKEAIYHFTNIAAPVVGISNLKTSVSSKHGRVNRTCQFIVVKIESSFDAILGWLYIHDINVIPLSYHQCK